jgi:hypothetical protein
MRLKFSIAILAALLFAGAASAQAHQATLTLKAPSDAVASSIYNVYRAAGSCPATVPGTLTWTKLTATPISVLTYTDSTISVGAWCYYVTQVQSGIESLPSIPAGGTAQPNTVTFTIVVQ